MVAFGSRPSEAATETTTRESAASGPFSSKINSALSASFGESLDGIEVQRGAGEANRALDSHAYTMGSTIALGDNVREDFGDPRSMEIISHEVAHALGSKGGSASKSIDSGKSDSGEVAAHAASSSFRDFIAGGAEGDVPKMSRAPSTSMIHRFEAGEHADAIDSARANMKAQGKEGESDATLKEMEKLITLANGVTVTQGQITAMMGDFYGAYKKGPDGKEHFDPIESFKQLENANPKEMEALKIKIDKEKDSVTDVKEHGGEFEHTEDAEFEKLTMARHEKTDDNGVTSGYSYMDLAQKNANHFNSKNESGTDNNMGAYAALHAAAAQQAQDAAAMEPGQAKTDATARALALEASSQHFMTDRFSAGHQFDKQQLIDNSAFDKLGNIRASVVHDKLNKGGTEVSDGSGAPSWHAQGDDHWADASNADNRDHTTQTVVNSYGDITAILSGEKKAKAVIDDPLVTAHKTAPIWNQTLNDQKQKEGMDLSADEIYEAEKKQVNMVPAMIKRMGLYPLHKIDDGIDYVEEKGGQALNWAEKKAGQALDWADKVGTDAVNWGEKKIGEGVDWAAKKGNEALDAGGKAIDYGEKKLGEGVDWAAKKGNEALDAGGKAIDYGEKKIGEGVDWAEKKGSEALDAGGKAIDYGEKKLGEGVDWAEKKGGEAIDYGEKKIGEGVDWAEKKGSEAVTAVSDGANKAWNAAGDAATGVGDGAKKAWGYLFD